MLSFSSTKQFHSIRRVSLPAAALLLSAASLSGSAFSINQLGARASGMATAFTAIADDASAIFFNPAGIAFQPGTQFQMDTLVVVGQFRFVPSSPLPGTAVPEKGFHGSVKPKFIPVGMMYFTRQLTPKWTFGFGVFSPFGLSDNFTNFNDGDPANTKFPGRWAGSRARLEEIWFQPTAAYRVSPNSSLALGVAYVHTHLFIEQSFLNPLDDALEFGRAAAGETFPGVDKELAARSLARLLPEGRSRIAGTARSPGFSAGYLYKHPGWKTNFGLMFRSAVVNHLKGKASFAFAGDYTLEKFVGADLLPKSFPTQDITGVFTTPATYGFGVANSSFWNSTISLEFRMQDYRRFRSLPLNFSKTPDNDADAQTPAERRLFFDFKDSFHAAVGFEKPLNERLVIRAGYLFDRTPVVDKSVGPLFPDNNQHSFSVGASRKMGNKEFTIYYQATQFVNRTVNVGGNAKLGTNGEYRNFAHLAGLGLRFHMGKPK